MVLSCRALECMLTELARVRCHGFSEKEVNKARKSLQVSKRNVREEEGQEESLLPVAAWDSSVVRELLTWHMGALYCVRISWGSLWPLGVEREFVIRWRNCGSLLHAEQP